MFGVLDKMEGLDLELSLTIQSQHLIWTSFNSKLEAPFLACRPLSSSQGVTSAMAGVQAFMVSWVSKMQKTHNL